MCQKTVEILLGAKISPGYHQKQDSTVFYRREEVDRNPWESKWSSCSELNREPSAYKEPCLAYTFGELTRFLLVRFLISRTLT